MHRINLTPIQFAAVAALGLFALTGPARADIHHDGQAKINGKGDGKHLLNTSAQNHVTHAQVSNGKVKSVSVTQQGNAVTVKKYKTSKKLHAQANLPNDGALVLENAADMVHVFAADADAHGAADGNELASAQFGPLVTTFVGYGYFNQFLNQWVVFWFPVKMVVGGDLGATALGGVIPTPTGGTTVLNTNGFCTMGGAATYNVQLQAGRQYFITLKTVQPNYYPFLGLYTVNNQLVAENINGAGFPNARIVFTPTATGTYKIGCGSVNNASSGTFSLLVQQSGP